MANQKSMNDLIFFVGDDWPIIPFQMSPVVNITGWTIQFSLYPASFSTSAIFTRSTPSEVTITSGTGGSFEVESIPALITGSLKQLVYTYRVHRVDSGYRREIAFGSLPVRW